MKVGYLIRCVDFIWYKTMLKYLINTEWLDDDFFQRANVTLVYESKLAVYFLDNECGWNTK